MDVNPSTQKSTKKPKANSEARKEQNRLASRHYRQKRKQKLAFLDQLLENPLDDVSQTIAASTVFPPQGPVPAIDVLPIPETTVQSSTRHSGSDGLFVPIDNAVPQPLFGESWDSFANPAPDTHFLAGPDSLFGLNSFEDTSSILDSSVAGVRTSTPNFTMGAMRTTALSPGGFPLADDFTTLLQSAATPSIAASVDGEVEEISKGPQDPMLLALESLRALSLNQKRQLLGILKIETAPEDVVTPEAEEPASTTVQTSSPRIRKEVKRYEKWLRRNLATRLPNVKINTVHLMQGSFYGAIFANSYAIGCHDKEVLLREDSNSPYTLDRTRGFDPDQLELVRPRFANVPSDLAPVDAQFTAPHHPYLDVIPFRLFRERAMAALACNPPMFDEEVMCKDFTADGLICWGSQSNDQGMEAGVPWDHRSWEPKVWFLKKYWFLVGGWEDEMWKSARWWHTMRDEKINHNDKFDFD